MATLVSQPTVFVTALRDVKFVFNIASIGVAPEKKVLIYMLKVNGVNAYQEYQIYNPVVDGQDIEIDFTKDLLGIVQTAAPTYGLPVTMFSSDKEIKSITVEFGERTSNSDTCETLDEIQGESEPIDVLNGIPRLFENALNNTFQVLSNRPKRYGIRRDSQDFLYVTGTLDVSVTFWDSSDVFITDFTYSSNETHPGAITNIIPIGFQGAPAGSNLIKVFIDQLISVDNPTGIYCTILSEDCGCQEGAPVDLYVQNHLGGVDLLTFDCVDTVTMNSVKQQIVGRYDGSETGILQKGQRRSINNNSFPVINLKKTFHDLDYKYSQWLNEMVASNNAWMVIDHQNGGKQLVRMEIQSGSVDTFGDETELLLSVQYSEVEVYPY